ncbi:MAG: hypothetical protein PF483_01370 [Halothiobacillus sp.]|nr:hypothetical protein [Halothiobacillus sp.]
MKNLTPLHYISGTGHAAQVSVHPDLVPARRMEQHHTKDLF